MHETIASPITAWQNFYVIVGSAAAALTGLQFVVIALIAEKERRSSRREIDAFGTPTIVHFCAVLLLAAILTAPWQELTNAGLALGASGLAGIVYVAIVTRRTRRQSGYQPVFEDWLWHVILPLLSYAGIMVAAILLQRDLAPMLFVIGTAALLLLFIGIHNSWDTVTYIAIDLPKPKEPEEQEERRGTPPVS
jgi:cell division protein FtsW (lipid II flippase)